MFVIYSLPCSILASSSYYLPYGPYYYLTYVDLTDMAHLQVLYNVLKAPEHLQYQLALLSSVSSHYYPSLMTIEYPLWNLSNCSKELREIFSNAPPNPKDSSSDDEDGKRKPIEGDCPICFMEFEPEKEEIVWCRSACGNNIHKTCFNQWAATSTADGIRCVYWYVPPQLIHGL
jgi:hypothetical protein